MTQTSPYNDQIPTDPTQVTCLLLLSAAVVGKLTPDQIATVTQVFGLATAIVPFLPRGGR